MTVTTAPRGSALRDLLVRLGSESLKAPPRLKVSAWANENIILPRESAEPGPWRTERAPYQRAIMDAFSDPGVDTVVVMSSAQIGKTSVINNVVGFHIDQDPAAILVVQPTLEMAKTWSKDRLATMLRDGVCFAGKVEDPRSRDSGNTMLHKEIVGGGRVTIVGSNSPSGLAGRPIRILLCDEIDRYEVSAGTEGDPIALARKRTATFWNRKIGMFSTPTVKGLSRIEKAFESTDQRRYWVPCPHCGGYQVLEWKGIVWDKGEDGGHLPETARYACALCGVLIEEVEKPRMLTGGEWRATHPGRPKVGFHINALYSPWTRWQEIVQEFIEVKKDPPRLQVWVNTMLGMTWEEEGDQADEATLKARRTDFGAVVPSGVGVLTAGVDVQGDRLELEVKGWGVGFESWVLRHERIYGDPVQEEVWQRLEVLLTKSYVHERGADMRIQVCCIDSGYHTESVYRYVRPRQNRGVRATKGVSQKGRPMLGRPAKANKFGVRVFPVGTDAAKDLLFARLKIMDPGPGYIHICSTADDEFIAQYAAEKAVTRYVRGVPTREYRQVRARNEAIDLEVLNLVALSILGPAVTEHLDHWVRVAVAAGEDEKKPENRPAPRAATGTSWVNRWRD